VDGIAGVDTDGTYEDKEDLRWGKDGEDLSLLCLRSGFLPTRTHAQALPMNSRVIAKNSFWYGVETFVELFLTIFTSVAIARSIGPEKLGYFLYMAWIATMVETVGTFGIPATTRKYMSEYFGRGQMGIARTVFYRTLRMQTCIAAVITVVSLFFIWFFGDPRYHLISLFIIGGMFPHMVNLIPALGNTALEDMRANVFASLVSTAIFVLAVFLSLHFGWNLLGISVGLFVMRAVELPIRLIPLIRRLNQHSPEPLDRILGKRMFVFSGQSLVLMVIGLVVWNRSEMVILKNFCADIRQVAFYSVAFNLTERLLLFSQVFGTATGATMMAQYGRNSSQVRGLVGTSVRYLALISFPVHFGLAAIAGPVMWIIYGGRYSEAVPALIVTACLGIPKAFLIPVQALLSSWERQDLIIRWGLISGALNLILDFALIPKHGALGAALANGTTQTFAALALWLCAVHLLKVRIPGMALLKTVLVSAAMAIVVHLAASRVPALPAAIGSVFLGTAVYLILLRMARVLGPADHGRMLHLKSHVPSSTRRIFETSLNWLISTSESSA
jgi:O-antigen/teichoic acid export membrane protein